MTLITKVCFFLLLLNCGLLYAQEFGSADSHWVYNVDISNGYVEVVFDKDTLINGDLYNSFLLRELFANSEDTTYTTYFEPLFLNNTNGLVSYSLGGEIFDTLINYNALPGESWTIPHRFLDESYVLNVQDTFTTFFSGIEYKALSYIIHEEDGFVGSFKDTIYEHWGFRHNFILPYDPFDSGAGNNLGGPILCFSNDALGTVEIGPDPMIYFGSVFPFDCNRLTSAEEINVSDSRKSLTLYPNPVSDFLHVSEVDIGTTYEVWSIKGEPLVRSDILSGSIDVEALSTGMYFLKVGELVKRFVKVE